MPGAAAAILLAGKTAACLRVSPLFMGKIRKLFVSIHLFAVLIWASVTGQARSVDSPWTGAPAGELRTSDIMREAKAVDEEKKEKKNIKFDFRFEFEMPEREDNVN